MKKVFALIGSRRKRGNTAKFVRSVVSILPNNEFEVEFGFPQDFKIKPCIGCHDCFMKTHCSVRDELDSLHNKILDSDIFIIASPVYVHYMTADLKLIIDKSSWWAHTLRMQGKPVVVLSTCASNGHNTVIEPLSKIMTLMGGNVIVTSNAAQMPDQIDNEAWLEEVSKEIAERITKYANLPPQSNSFLEQVFQSNKPLMLQQEKNSIELKFEARESRYWRETGMFDYDSFEDFLSSKK